MKMSVDVVEIKLEGAVEVVALAFGRDGLLYGGTTGAKDHLLFSYRPSDGAVADLGGKVVSGNQLFTHEGGRSEQKIHKALIVGPDGTIYGGTGQNVGAGSPNCRTWDDDGGHVFSYDPATGACRDFGVPVPHHWIINMTADAAVENLYGMTYPLNFFFHVERKTGKMRIAGQLHGGTYGDSGCSHEIICDLDGNVYGSCESGYIFKYDPRTDTLTETDVRLPGGDARIDSLARDEDGTIYGGTWESGHLFSLDPATMKLRDLGQPNKGPRLPAIAVKDGVLYGTAGGGDAYKTRTAFLFRYDLKSGRLEELGDIACREKKIRGQRMHMMAIGDDGTLYFGETGATTSPDEGALDESGYIKTGLHAFLFMVRL